MYHAADDDWGVNVDSSWNVIAHSDAREGKWRGNWRMEWVAITLHTTSEHGVSSITTADAHTSAASSRLNWQPRRFKWTRPFGRKTKFGFCVCAITFQIQSTNSHSTENKRRRLRHLDINIYWPNRSPMSRYGRKRKHCPSDDILNGLNVIPAVSSYIGT